MARSRQPDEKASPLAFDRVDRPSLADMAYARISRSILDGAVPPGTQLKETHLADQLGMSRAPIREAFKRLADEHLVVERPRYGVFVREFDADDIADVYNVRVAIETTAVRLFIRARASTEPLRALIDEMQAAATKGDTEAVVDAEVRFHQTLCEQCGNDYLSGVFHSLQGPIHMAMGMDDRNYVIIDEIVREHEPVVEALEGGDEQTAAAVIAEHITSSVAAVIERLGGDPRRVLA